MNSTEPNIMNTTMIPCERCKHTTDNCWEYGSEMHIKGNFEEVSLALMDNTLMSISKGVRSDNEDGTFNMAYKTDCFDVSYCPWCGRKLEDAKEI